MNESVLSFNNLKQNSNTTYKNSLRNKFSFLHGFDIILFNTVTIPNQIVSIFFYLYIEFYIIPHFLGVTLYIVFDKMRLHTYF